MKCRDCKFLSDPTDIHQGDYPSVRCTLGLWDKEGIPQWYSFGESQLNRGPVRRYGEACTRGEPKVI
ncbi:unnamed protein product [marine sediment metagenome]|uniref:Uncharacterized protein n=1 Tax=marine sediment metagenome TaxID=412755 RepID=X1HEQ3_9ZZZZ